MGVPLRVYTASQAVLSEAEKQCVLGELIRTGITIHSCICGPCFGSTNITSNNTISVRYVSRNHYSREVSRPDQGQLSASALMDARSIAATVRRGGRLTAVAEVLTAGMEDGIRNVDYGFDDSYYHTAVSGATSLQAYIPAEGRMLTLSIGDMTDDERKILVAGSMINY